MSLTLVAPTHPLKTVSAPASFAATPWPVFLFACLIGFGASIWSWHTGSMTLYNDSRAHLDIARQVTDSLTPGLAQLGTVWLPLDQLLLVPLVAIPFLWHSGFAGAIVSGLAFAYASFRLYSLANEWFDSRLAAWVALIVFAANINLLYLQTTALDEPLLLAFFIGAVFHFARWTRTLSPLDLFISACLVAGATLTRYEGWAIFLAGVVLVFWWSKFHERRRQATESTVLIFAVVSGYGIAMWLLYNLIIFHNPIAFFSSPGSTASQQLVLEKIGELGTAHNLKLSALVYGWDVLDVCGMVVVILGILGSAWLLLRRSNRARSFAILGLLLSPVLFQVVALYLGQITINVPQVAPHNMWNDLYGIEALPILALGAAALVAWRAYLAPVVLALVLASMALMAWQTPITLADGRVGTSSASSLHPAAAAAYLNSHYRGGEILADNYHVSALMFASNLDLRNFVTIGEHPYYQRSLKNPAAHVVWVIAQSGDTITKDMDAHPGRFTNFKLVFHHGDIKLFKRSSSQ